MKKTLLLLILVLLAVCGCAMFGAWKSIPPPGGCDQCHTKQISANWQVAYKPADISDGTGRYPWQQPSSVAPTQPSPLEQQKVTEQRCFRCHKGPDKAHTEYRGRYHH